MLRQDLVKVGPDLEIDVFINGFGSNKKISYPIRATLDKKIQSKVIFVVLGGFG